MKMNRKLVGRCGLAKAGIMAIFQNATTLLFACMKKEVRTVLLAAAVFASAASTHAATYSGDLLIGFTTTSGNDFILDLGQAASLTSGQTFNLSSQLAGFNLNNVHWGVIGDKNVSGTRTVWTTVAAALPNTVPSTATWGTIDTATRAIYQGFVTGGAGDQFTIAATDDNSWNQQTVNGSIFTQYHNAYEDPNIIGTGTVKFYSLIATDAPPVLIGNFTLGTNRVVTFVRGSTPAAPQLTVARVGTTNLISFPSANGATYTLYYTNAAGLVRPLSTWPASPTTIAGDGSIKTFTNSPSDSERFYRVGAH
jgi:hypothetical protein